MFGQWKKTLIIHNKDMYAHGAVRCVMHTIGGNGGARGVMVIVVGNGHGDTSSNPGQDWLHFTKH